VTAAIVIVRAATGGPSGGPEATVREFFDAWSRGDAATVVRDSVLKPSGTSKAGLVWDQRALASMLSIPQNRRLMTGVTITETTTQGNVSSVRVTLRYNGVPYFMRLDVQQLRGHWQLAMYPCILRLTFPSIDSTVVIDGVPVHGNAGSEMELDVCPGAHRVHMDGSPIVAAADTVTTPVEPTRTVDVSPTQTLTPAAVAAAQGAIHSWLTTCANATQLQPGNGCPQSTVGFDTVSNVHWTLTGDGSDARVDMATLTSASATGTWAMTATWDEQFQTLFTHHQAHDSGRFSLILTWNGSGFDLKAEQ